MAVSSASELASRLRSSSAAAASASRAASASVRLASRDRHVAAQTLDVALQRGHQRLERLALGGGETGRFRAGVDLAAGLGQRQFQRLVGVDLPRAFALRLGEAGLRRGEPRVEVGVAGDQARHLRLEFGDLGGGGVAFLGQGGDQRLLTVGAAALQTQRIGEIGDLQRQLVELLVLPGDRVAQRRTARS